MTRGRTSSPLRLGARRNKAKDLFIKGYSVTEVARELQVSPDTASRYKKTYEAEIHLTAATNPDMLRNVVANTMRILEEVERVREAAWKEHESANTASMRNQCLGTVLKAEEQRMKLFGLLGVKADYAMHVANVRTQQEKLIQFMTEHLCPADRILLENFIVAEFSSDLANMPVTEGIDG